jgi:hypothetical protein
MEWGINYERNPEARKCAWIQFCLLKILFIPLKVEVRVNNIDKFGFYLLAASIIRKGSSCLRRCTPSSLNSLHKFYSLENYSNKLRVRLQNTASRWVRTLDNHRKQTIHSTGREFSLIVLPNSFCPLLLNLFTWLQTAAYTSQKKPRLNISSFRDSWNEI